MERNRLGETRRSIQFVKKLLLILFLPFVGSALGQPPPISTNPLSVNASTHVIYPTDATSGMITDAMSALSNKPWCRLASTVNMTLSGTATQIDSITPNAGDVVFLSAQTAGAENGPWVVASGSWTRPAWYASGHTLQAFLNIGFQIRTGTQYTGTWWRMTTSSAVTIDTTATTWLQTSPLSLEKGITGITAQNLATMVTASGRTGIALTATLTSDNSGNVSDGDTVTIRARAYTFKTTVVSNDQVKIGANNDASLLNLSRAINKSGGSPPTDYSVTTANVDVSASTVSAHAITVTALFGISLTLTLSETASTLAWSNNLTTANMAFSVAPTLSGLVSLTGSLQIGTGTTAPQPLFAVAPVSGPIAMTFKIPGTGDYAQLAYKNSSDAQRGFIGYIGSAFGNPLRRDHFEFGTASGVPIVFRPGDGDGVGFTFDDSSVLHIANVATSTGAKLIAFPNTSQPAAIPAGSPSCGQLYMQGDQLKFLTPGGSPIPITP